MRRGPFKVVPDEKRFAAFGTKVLESARLVAEPAEGTLKMRNIHEFGPRAGENSSRRFRAAVTPGIRTPLLPDELFEDVECRGEAERDSAAPQPVFVAVTVWIPRFGRDDA